MFDHTRAQNKTFKRVSSYSITPKQTTTKILPRISSFMWPLNKHESYRKTTKWTSTGIELEKIKTNHPITTSMRYKHQRKLMPSIPRKKVISNELSKKQDQEKVNRIIKKDNFRMVRCKLFQNDQLKKLSIVHKMRNNTILVQPVICRIKENKNLVIQANSKSECLLNNHFEKDSDGSIRTVSSSSSNQRAIVSRYQTSKMFAKPRIETVYDDNDYKSLNVEKTHNRNQSLTNKTCPCNVTICDEYWMLELHEEPLLQIGGDDFDPSNPIGLLLTYNTQTGELILPYLYVRDRYLRVMMHERQLFLLLDSVMAHDPQIQFDAPWYQLVNNGLNNLEWIIYLLFFDGKSRLLATSKHLFPFEIIFADSKIVLPKASSEKNGNNNRYVRDYFLVATTRPVKHDKTRTNSNDQMINCQTFNLCYHKPLKSSTKLTDHQIYNEDVIEVFGYLDMVNQP